MFREEFGVYMNRKKYRDIKKAMRTESGIAKFRRRYSINIKDLLKEKND